MQKCSNYCYSDHFVTIPDGVLQNMVKLRYNGAGI